MNNKTIKQEAGMNNMVKTKKQNIINFQWTSKRRINGAIITERIRRCPTLGLGIHDVTPCMRMVTSIHGTWANDPPVHAAELYLGCPHPFWRTSSVVAGTSSCPWISYTARLRHNWSSHATIWMASVDGAVAWRIFLRWPASYVWSTHRKTHPSSNLPILAE